MIRTALLAILVAVFLTATAGTDFEPDRVQATVATVYIVGLLALGVLGGWRAVLLFAFAFGGAAAVHEIFFWVDDPARSGTDDLTPTAFFIFGLPFMLLPIAAGAVVGKIARRRGRYPRRA